MSDSLVINPLLHLYDQLSISTSSNTNRDSIAAGMCSYPINWSVPAGCATFFVDANRSRYNQTVAGFEEPVVYSGSNSEVNADINGALHRDATSRTDA